MGRLPHFLSYGAPPTRGASRCAWSPAIKLRLIVIPTNLEFRARERQRERESRRQASEDQREKGRQRSRARDEKDQGDIFLLEEKHQKFCSGGDNMRNASGHQCKVKISGSEKK